MRSKIKLIFFTLLIFGASFYYFSTSPSYQNSTQARVYYFLGNYEKAYELAKISLEEDIYNKMASTVLTQSKIAKEYEAYIELGNEFLKRIDKISLKEEFSKEDRVRVKMMCQIMIESYSNLAPSTLTKESLQESSKKMQKKFIQLYEELF
jgi:tetratricopeptide (TPR) repeat protein